MSNSTRVTALRHALLAVVAVVTTVALVAGLNLLPASGVAGNDINVEENSLSASVPPAAAMPVYPKAQGWMKTRNKIRYRIYKKQGKVVFWTALEDNAVAILWRNAALRGGGTGFYYGQKPKAVKFKKCGKRTYITISGYAGPGEARWLPAWPCKYAKKNKKK